MKRSILQILLMLLPLLASAETVEIDGIWYNLISKVKEAEVTRNPSGDKYSGDVEISASVTYSDIKYSVTTIGANAFYWCTGLTSVTIPNSVNTISANAFYGCRGLTSVTIPNSVTSIGSCAFCDCSGLTSVTIPSSVTFIDNAFHRCTGLTSITIPSTLTSIGGFEKCSSLTSVTIPNTVTEIRSYAFSNCSALTSVTIPNSVTSIDIYAFAECSGLTSVTIGRGVQYVGDDVFGKCDDLTDVYCLAEKLRSDQWSGEGLYTGPDAFKDSYPQAITLHVPAASIEAYSSTEPWLNFKAIVPLEDDDIPKTEKCATPEIIFENGKVKFTCETEGVDFISEVTVGDAKKYYDSEFTLSQKYKISVYATKTGYYNSETTTREIEIKGDNKPIVVGDVDGNGKVNVADHVKLSDIILNK